ncbi:hypothetical protein EVAR_82348_1 [Eumeta japonica]|uniref:Uncharacterized protein n=1 Tax=Eumeta variegata TaxID=151549 RepID=A0A4C1UB85_EUMVA|nr:hypothetical protein EVAR_82348_1 [Eumeta japonica]
MPSALTPSKALVCAQIARESSMCLGSFFGTECDPVVYLRPLSQEDDLSRCGLGGRTLPAPGQRGRLVRAPQPEMNGAQERDATDHPMIQRAALAASFIAPLLTHQRDRKIAHGQLWGTVFDSAAVPLSILIPLPPLVSVRQSRGQIKQDKAHMFSDAACVRISYVLVGAGEACFAGIRHGGAARARLEQCARARRATLHQSTARHTACVTVSTVSLFTTL